MLLPAAPLHVSKTPHALPCCLLFPNLIGFNPMLGLDYGTPPSPLVSYLILRNAAALYREIKYEGAQASQERRSDLALFQ